MAKCGKVCYGTKARAKAVPKKLRAKGYNRALRVYFCASCDCWHTTSFTAKAITAMKDKRMEDKNDNNSIRS